MLIKNPEKYKNIERFISIPFKFLFLFLICY
jgi:hypothetical protein